MAASADVIVVHRSSRSWWMRRLCCENPGYILSAAFVIRSTGTAIQQRSDDLSVWWLAALICSYMVLLAASGILIVRRWQVWDDARSIALILVLLMLELSLCFDDLVMTNWLQASLALAATGIGSILLTEAMLRGLRLRFPWIYRGPFYLQMLLCMGAGAGISLKEGSSSNFDVRWAICCFSLLCGISILTLIPAARADAKSVQTAGCPWIWPIHPWSLFVVVWVCMGFRIDLLTLSFDPADELGRTAAYQDLAGIFGPYLLVPLLMAIGWLLVEAGLAHRRRQLQLAGLVVPWLCVALSLLPAQGNPAATHFLNEFTAELGSPAWCTVWLTLLFSVVTASRGLRGAWRFCQFAGITLCWVGPETGTWRELTEFQMTPCLIISSAVLGIGFWRAQTSLIFEASCWLAAGLWMDGKLDGWNVSPPALCLYLTLLSAALICLAVRDEFTQSLQLLVRFFCLLSSTIVAFGNGVGFWTGWLVIAYLWSLCLTQGLLTWRYDPARTKSGVIWNAGAAYLTTLLETGRSLLRIIAWQGLWEFLLGLGLLHAALMGSFWKGRRRQAKSTHVAASEAAR